MCGDENNKDNIKNVKNYVLEKSTTNEKNSSFHLTHDRQSVTFGKYNWAECFQYVYHKE